MAEALQHANGYIALEEDQRNYKKQAKTPVR